VSLLRQNNLQMNFLLQVRLTFPAAAAAAALLFVETLS
jgi:hypothetical protein